MVLAVCRGILKNASDVEDAFQASFLVLLRKSRTLWIRDSLASWLYRVSHRIAVQTAVSDGRRRRRERRVAETRPSDTVDIATTDLRSVLFEEIERLPDPYRAPIILCYFEGLSEAMAARQLRCPVGTVSGRLSRARRLLRARLSRRGIVSLAGFGAPQLMLNEVSARVPEPLWRSTVKAVVGASIGRSGVPLSVASIVRRSMNAMLWSKLKTAGILVLATTSLGVLLSAYSDLWAEPPGPDRQSERQGSTETQPSLDGPRPSVPGERELERIGLPTPVTPTFDGFVFERLVSGAVERPLFIDLDTGRFMRAPFDLERIDRSRPLSVSNLKFTLRVWHWIRAQGIDAAVQTDGRTIELVGLDLRIGALSAPAAQREDPTPADILAEVDHLADPTQAGDVTPVQVFDKATFWSSVLPFVTREASIGELRLSFSDPMLRGPNVIRLNYRLVRGFRPDGHDQQPHRPVAEPAILRAELAGFLIVEARSGTLCLRLPGTLDRIEVARHRVTVLEGANTLLEASRLATGALDIDAQNDRVVLYGRGGEATFTRTGDKVRVTMDHKWAESERLVPALPELRFLHQLTWHEL
jgi:RNA polymerase sigma factor (sigma-70 family)